MLYGRFRLKADIPCLTRYAEAHLDPTLATQRRPPGGPFSRQPRISP